MALYYLDTSAAFKLLAAEEHAEAFLAFYREHRSDDWISSDLLRIEVSRTVTRTWPALSLTRAHGSFTAAWVSISRTRPW